MARQPSYGLGRHELPDVTNPTTGIKLGHAGLEKPIAEPTLGTGQRNPGIAPATSPTHVAPLQAVNPNQVTNPSPSTTTAAPHIGGMPEVTVSAPEKKIVGTTSTLISPPPPSTPLNKPKYNGPYGFGTAQTGYKSFDTARKEQIAKESPNVYRKSAIANTGEEIPMGSTGQSPKDQLAHVSGRTGMTAAQAIGQSGSISDIRQAEEAMEAPVPGLAPDVRQAVNDVGSASQSFAKPKMPRKK